MTLNTKSGIKYLQSVSVNNWGLLPRKIILEISVELWHQIINDAGLIRYEVIIILN